MHWRKYGVKNILIQIPGGPFRKQKENKFISSYYICRTALPLRHDASPASVAVSHSKIEKMNFVEEMTLYTMATSLICINQLLAELTPLQRDHLVGTRVAAD